MIDFGFRTKSVAVVGPIRGWVLQHRRVVLIVLLALSAVCVSSWATKSQAVWADGWGLYWSLPELWLPGILISFAPALFIWLVLPMTAIAISGRSTPYVRYREDRLWLGILLAFTVIACALTTILAPLFTVVIYRSGAGGTILILGSLFFSVSGLKLVAESVRRYRSAKGQRPIVRFPDELRPLSDEFVNLDVGGLAPRLNVVSNALQEWSRLVDGTAPTAQVYWRAVEDPNSDIPQDWKKTLRNRAWKGVENFRRQIGGFLQIPDSWVYFFPSTTRALNAVLESIPDYDAIVTTNAEHNSEQLVAAVQQSKRKIQICTVDIVNPLLAGQSLESIPKSISDAAANFRHPVVLLSEVPYCLGVRLPIADIAAALRAAVPSAVLLVDGAHAVGHVEVALGDLDFDYYVFSGHKWLFGPASLGILITGRNIQPDLIDRLRREAFESLAAPGRTLGDAGATVALEPFVGCAESLARLAQVSAQRQVQDNIRALREFFVTASNSDYSVIALPAVSSSGIAPGILNIQGGKRTLNLQDLGRVRNDLETRYKVVTKLITNPPSLRVCVPFYLSRKEAERAVSAIRRTFAEIST